ncbi:helix-turn-helix transcriptional regulator [Elizabethkingia anophelis]|nr:helix-turn-helix transcriptional regulator [Elizabethkingia anophelis]
MTNKEKYLRKIADQESLAVKEAKERLKNKSWLKGSKKLALRILIRLDELNWSQKDLADKLFVTPPYINKLLKGNEKFGWEILHSLEEILNLPILYGFQSTNEVKTKTYSEDGTFHINPSNSIKKYPTETQEKSKGIVMHIGDWSTPTDTFRKVNGY